MKKSLIALAVAGAFAAPAFAATENVDVYGKVHMSVSVVDDQWDTTVVNGAGDVVKQPINDLQFTSNASRIGFKGAEDLGGGLSAIWQIESGVNLDDGSGNFASRNSFVGLKGGFGTLLAGRHDTPLKLVGRAVDLFGDTLADSRNVMTGVADTRANNVVAYISPSFAGLTVAAAYSTDLSTGTVNGGADKEDVGLYNLNATYTNGPIYLGLGYGDGDGHEAAGKGAHIRAAGGLTFGNFKVVGQYDTVEDDTAASNDFDAFMVGGAFTLGNAVLKANYMTGEFDVSPNEPTQWTIGADYNLSKRTTVYALYVAGEEGVVLGKGAGSSDQIESCATCGGDISGLSVGLTHSF